MRQKGFRKAVEQNDEVIACVGGGVSVPEKLEFVRQKGSRKFLKQKGFRFRQSCRLRRGRGERSRKARVEVCVPQKKSS